MVGWLRQRRPTVVRDAGCRARRRHVFRRLRQAGPEARPQPYLVRDSVGQPGATSVERNRFDCEFHADWQRSARPPWMKPRPCPHRHGRTCAGNPRLVTHGQKDRAKEYVDGCARKLAGSSRWKSGPGKGQRPPGSECCVSPSATAATKLYTAIVWGGLLSREIVNVTEAEAVHPAEGNMCGTAMRGADARSWSKIPSRTKGTRRNPWPPPGLRRGRLFNFLGFTHISGKDRRGGFQLKRKTRRDRMTAKLLEVKEDLRRRMHRPIPEQGEWLKRVVSGFFNYHAVPTNSRALATFRHRVTVLWQRTLRRRSQKDRTAWDRTAGLVDDWLPRARILHPWPSARFAVRHPRWEPYAGKPHVRFCAGGAQ